MQKYDESLPFPVSAEIFENFEILKALAIAHRNLAELKGSVRGLPNERLLISTLALQEAESSSAIENIVTTQQELLAYRLNPHTENVSLKEAARYAESIDVGYQEIRRTESLSHRAIMSIQQTLMGRESAQWRALPGTVIKNNKTGEVIYTPPSPEKIPDLMRRLESYINQPEQNSDEVVVDPLVRMALIHLEFERIHPFYDGNGRTGRIINILFLVKEDLLNMPILYLSRYINQTRDRYYELLQTANDGQWQAWVLYMLRGVSVTARHTLVLVDKIFALYEQRKEHIRTHHKFYSRDLLDNIFSNPYTNVTLLARDIKSSRITAWRYLDALAADGTLRKYKDGRENYYVNADLVDLLVNLPDMDAE